MESPQPKIRKQLIGRDPPARSSLSGELDLVADAVLHYTSEHPDHPVDNILDRADGPGGTCWQGAVADAPQTLLIEFDQPRDLSRLHYEVAEAGTERTQEIRVEVSTDAGTSYRQILAQDYTFSPRGATFQVEDLALDLPGVTHLRLTIVPNKQGSGRATLTSLRIFGR